MAITNIILAIAVIAIGVAFGFILPSMQTTSAQNLSSTENSKITSLGSPFFIEKGRIIGHRVLSVGPQPQIEFTVVANATINGNISATNTGTTVSTLQDNGVFRSTGQGFIMTEDGEVATYTSQVVGTPTEDGGVKSLGTNIWSTNSTGKLAFLNDMVNIFNLQADGYGNFSAMGWEWK
ncbi:MAG: hypothetical protein WCA61_07105 [Nitrososphaeraceae archaeon]